VGAAGGGKRPPNEPRPTTAMSSIESVLRTAMSSIELSLMLESSSTSRSSTEPWSTGKSSTLRRSTVS
jgi:hypothetical protein